MVRLHKKKLWKFQGLCHPLKNRLERNVASAKLFLFCPWISLKTGIRESTAARQLSTAITCYSGRCSLGHLLKEVFHLGDRLSRRSARSSAVSGRISRWNAEQMRRQVGRRGTPYWQRVLLVSTLAPWAPFESSPLLQECQNRRQSKKQEVVELTLALECCKPNPARKPWEALITRLPPRALKAIFLTAPPFLSSTCVPNKDGGRRRGGSPAGLLWPSLRLYLRWVFGKRRGPEWMLKRC